MVHRDLKLENILVSTENPDKQFDIKVGTMQLVLGGKLLPHLLSRSLTLGFLT